jgi:hypothetical protein
MWFIKIGSNDSGSKEEGALNRGGQYGYTRLCGQVIPGLTAPGLVKRTAFKAGEGTKKRPNYRQAFQNFVLSVYFPDDSHHFLCFSGAISIYEVAFLFCVKTTKLVIVQLLVVN